MNLDDESMKAQEDVAVVDGSAEDFEYVKPDRPLRVLIACEESQKVCSEFRRRGHEAYSCDLLPTSGSHPEWHITGDALEVAKMQWDLVIAFPPCTHLAVSGAKYFKQKQRDGRQQMGIGTFLAFTALDHVPMVAIENPVGIMSKIYREPDQIIQPFWFGDPARKSTCLWLKGLPKLVPTKMVEPELVSFVSEDGTVQTYSKDSVFPDGPRNERRSLRSKTYPGIARAMAQQWGGNVRKPKS